MTPFSAGQLPHAWARITGLLKPARQWLLLSVLVAGPASAHSTRVIDLPWWQSWSLAATVVVPLLTGATLYTLGVFRLWRRAGIGRVVSRVRATAYGAGILVLVVALLSPLEGAVESSFALHMVQHLLLILVAPPLLIAGKPDIAFLWALPQGWRSGWGRFEKAAGMTLTQARGQLAVILTATGTLWLWHWPRFYDLAVDNEAVHWAEHASFLITSLLFWITVLRLRPTDHNDNGLRILYVFGMAVQGSLLGGLITFANRPLYQSYTNGSPWADLDALADQQLAGLIMWVPPALLYIGVAAYLFVSWMKALEKRNNLQKRHS